MPKTLTLGLSVCLVTCLMGGAVLPARSTGHDPRPLNRLANRELFAEQAINLLSAFTPAPAPSLTSVPTAKVDREAADENPFAHPLPFLSPLFDLEGVVAGEEVNALVAQVDAVTAYRQYRKDFNLDHRQFPELDKLDRTAAFLRAIVRRRIGTSDIVIGMPFYDEVRTAPHVMKTIAEGLRIYFPDRKATFIAMGEMASGEIGGEVEQELKRSLSGIKNMQVIVLRRSSEYRGKGAADFLMKNVADALGASAYAHFDADLWTIHRELWRAVPSDIHDADIKNQYYKDHLLSRLDWSGYTDQKDLERDLYPSSAGQSPKIKGFSPYWVKGVVQPALVDPASAPIFVVPGYPRHYFDAKITHLMMYPMARAIYRADVRQPIGGDFGYNRALVHLLLSKRSLWRDADFTRYGFDNAITWYALANGCRVFEAALGEKIDAPDPRFQESSLYFENPAALAAFFHPLILAALIDEQLNVLVPVEKVGTTADGREESVLLEKQLPRDLPFPLFTSPLEGLSVIDGKLVVVDGNVLRVKINKKGVMLPEIFSSAAKSLICHRFFWSRAVHRAVQSVDTTGPSYMRDLFPSSIDADYTGSLQRFSRGIKRFGDSYRQLFGDDLYRRLEMLDDAAQSALASPAFYFYMEPAMFQRLMLESYYQFLLQFTEPAEAKTAPGIDRSKIPMLVEPIWQGARAGFFRRMFDFEEGSASAFAAAASLVRDQVEALEELWVGEYCVRFSEALRASA